MLTFQRELPETTGVPSERILNFIDRLKRQGIPMHSILLLRHDRLIAEGYYAPYKADTLHRMFSVSKSFTAVAIGLLIDEGKLSLDDPIISYFPDKVPANVHPWIASMTIRDMLMMRTCHASTTYKLDMTTDWVESFFTVPPTHPAGKLFHYDTSSAHTLCALVERLSGMPMLDYIKDKLAPLGLSGTSYMLTDPFGVSMGGSGLVATPMDLLKFGYFIFRGGNVDGKQLLSPSYLRTATSKLTDTLVKAPVRSEACGYGYQFWRNERGGYVCYGMGGQLIIFLPDYDLICVTTADTQGIGGGNQMIYDALYEELLPYLSNEPLSPCPGKYAALCETLDDLHILPLDGALSSPRMPSLSGRLWRAAENSMGFSDIRLDFSANKEVPGGGVLQMSLCAGADAPGGGVLHFTLHGKEYALSFGMGHLAVGSFPLYDMRYAASGVWLTPDTLYIKAHIIDEYVGSVHFQLCFGEDDLTVFMKKQEESLFHEFNGHLYCTAYPRG